MKRLPAVLLALLLPCLALAQPLVPLSPEARKELNTFCSAFAEANMPSFDQTSLSDAAMRAFAIWHCIMHPDASLARIHDGADIVIPAAVVDTITRAYLGRTIGKHEKPAYVDSLASGEAFVFAQADSLRRRDDGTFLVAGTLYYTRAETPVDPHGTTAQWKRSVSKVRISGTFSGVLKREDAPKPHWVMLQYAVKETP